MPKTRQQKEVTVGQLTAAFKQTKSVVFATFAGLKVADVNQLRAECRQSSVGYQVAKKTLLQRALTAAGLTDVDPSALGNGGVVTLLGLTDEVAPAKLVYTFAKTHEGMVIVGGILEQHFIAAAKVTQLAKLPSRDKLLAKAVGSIAAPLAGLVNVLQGNLRGLVFVLKAIQTSKQ